MQGRDRRSEERKRHVLWQRIVTHWQVLGNGKREEGRDKSSSKTTEWSRMKVR